MSVIKSLPSMEHSFTASIKGTETGQMFEGTFTCRRPNLRIQSEIAKTEAILNGGLSNLDDDMRSLHRVFATLKHVIIQSPEWWVKSDLGFNLYDVNVPLELYKTYKEFDDKWFKQVWLDEKEEPVKV